MLAVAVHDDHHITGGVENALFDFALASPPTSHPAIRRKRNPAMGQLPDADSPLPSAESSSTKQDLEDEPV